MDKLKKLLPTLIFNIVETLIIFLCGIALSLEVKYVLMIMLTFMISRGLFGEALHFKTWYRCLIWSTFIMLSLFVLLKVDLILSILFAVFSAFIMTGKSNIGDMYMWTGKVHEMMEHYSNYSEARDAADRGNYGAEEDSMKSLDYMLKCACIFMDMLEEEAGSPEEAQLIKKYKRKMAE